MEWTKIERKYSRTLWNYNPSPLHLSNNPLNFRVAECLLVTYISILTMTIARAISILARRKALKAVCDSWMHSISTAENDNENRILFYIYWDFRIKFCCVKKRFGFYFDQSERRNEFLTREKIVSSNHKPRLKRIVFSRAFSRSSRVPLSGSFDKIIFSVYLSKKFVRKRSENSRPQIVFRTDIFPKIAVGCLWFLELRNSVSKLTSLRVFERVFLFFWSSINLSIGLSRDTNLLDCSAILKNTS